MQPGCLAADRAAAHDRPLPLPRPLAGDGQHRSRTRYAGSEAVSRSSRTAKAAASRSRHSGIGDSPACVHDVFDSTEYAGRGAGWAIAAVVVGRTRAASWPASSNTVRATVNHVVSPPAEQW